MLEGLNSLLAFNRAQDPVGSGAAPSLEKSPTDPQPWWKMAPLGTAACMCPAENPRFDLPTPTAGFSLRQSVPTMTPERRDAVLYEAVEAANEDVDPQKLLRQLRLLEADGYAKPGSTLRRELVTTLRCYASGRMDWYLEDVDAADPESLRSPGAQYALSLVQAWPKEFGSPPVVAQQRELLTQVEAALARD